MIEFDFFSDFYSSIEIKIFQEVWKMGSFNYNEYWALEEPKQKPHDEKADELGISVDDIPVSPVLTRLKDSLRRIEEIYNVAEIREEGIDVVELLNKHTESEVIEILESNGFENAISLAEIENSIMFDNWQEILQIPRVKTDFFLLRQFEEGSNGRMIDVSAFNTADFLRGTENYEFDSYRYFTDKLAEKVEDWAIMHSCIGDEEGRNSVKQRYIILVNSKYRDYALRLSAMIRAAKDEEKKAELIGKLREQNKQIIRLRAVWNKYAYNW